MILKFIIDYINCDKNILIMDKLRKKLNRLVDYFNENYGWFFTNGMKQGSRNN